MGSVVGIVAAISGGQRYCSAGDKEGAIDVGRAAWHGVGIGRGIALPGRTAAMATAAVDGLAEDRLPAPTWAWWLVPVGPEVISL